ncbi:DUF6779 domain-containing protein [Mycolicibacterium holsaticum]|uniref:DUF6779 domain-containing protein n=1 Tax=Mycolicibacterium holsaticum TaxID=152142 RepID=UPI001C7CA78F|nr:DUF6779 domain-containing protein [Mycolicibacterium holsaticum]MDA4106567.1 membrane protein [Mycolicibacterium holsaticum DSM 44478 = JCM 12374]QZA13144.1 hypothetical protein K3U96_02855 [Mycolicibacterium holsaticum DSM 44478 = JCM 12374]UNC09384.1 hypothetical protein H5U41_23970 [Mycolicibacterium holsaticum DSM 44478 = JCM 12374]
MTDLPRSARPRRSGRRPSWVLLSALLVLAIAASSALVFTNRVELLKLAVILALWAAVVAAFVSVIYRRQSDADQAKVRDLKLVYDLQLDREISARREYELSVETHLRRELATELRAQAADEVAALRAELAALRSHLEVLFDAELSDRPALETERTTVRAYSDWDRDEEPAARLGAGRIDTGYGEDHNAQTDESPIIDVPAEPHPPEFEWVPPPPSAGGAHRRPSEAEPEEPRQFAEEPRVWAPPPPPPPPPPAPEPEPEPEPAAGSTHFSWAPLEDPAPQPEPSAAHPPATGWHPAPADGQWLPPGAPGSNWVAPVEEDRPAQEYVGKRRAPEPTAAAPEPSPTPPGYEPPRRGRHSGPAETADPGAAAEEPEQPTPRRRRRAADDEQTGGQSVAELLARLQASPTGGGRRRRREE